MRFNVITKKINDFLSLSYPFLFSGKNGWAYISAIGIIIAVLINLQQPFGLHAWEHPYKWLILSAFGWINAATSIILLLILSRLFPVFFCTLHWTVGKEISLFVFLFIVSGIFNWVHAVITLSGFTVSWISFFRMQFYTFAFGSLPVTALSLFAQILYLRKKIITGEEISEIYRPPLKKPLTQVIISINEERCNIHDILFLKSEGNYVEVHVFAEGKKEMKLCRKTLKEFETILASYSQFVRCKKSYIVNMNKVTGYKGNSEGMILKLENCADRVEVSRKFVPAIRKFMGEK